MNAFLYSSELDSGGYPDECPFNTSRAGRTREAVISMGLLDGDNKEVAPISASRESLSKFHTLEYLDILERAGHGDISPDDALKAGLGTPDCPIFDNMFEYVSLAAGATLTAVDLILRGEAEVAFNPSGGFHHAQPDHAAGFCYLNDIALALLVLREAGKRVVFLDIDVHHCDGVQDAFYDSGDVMTISLHESGKTLFPGTGYENELGDGDGLGQCVNVPLPVGTYDEAYERIFRDVAVPAVARFDPDVIIVEAGMDSLAGDPLAHLNLTNNTHAHIVERMMQFDKPLLVTGGGGYNVKNTVRGWSLLWSVLSGEEQHDLMLGMGGVMMENTDWVAGLRDRMLISDAGSRPDVNAEIERLIEFHKSA